NCPSINSGMGRSVISSNSSGVCCAGVAVAMVVTSLVLEGRYDDNSRFGTVHPLRNDDRTMTPLDTIAPLPCSSRAARANEAPTQLRELPLVQVVLPPLPASRAEMERRGWDAVDVVFVTGDAYVDHPAFAMAILGRVLEAAGFRVAILSQPDWRSAKPWR